MCYTFGITSVYAASVTRQKKKKTWNETRSTIHHHHQPKPSSTPSSLLPACLLACLPADDCVHCGWVAIGLHVVQNGKINNSALWVLMNACVRFWVFSATACCVFVYASHSEQKYHKERQSKSEHCMTPCSLLYKRYRICVWFICACVHSYYAYKQYINAQPASKLSEQRLSLVALSTAPNWGLLFSRLAIRRSAAQN